MPCLRETPPPRRCRFGHREPTRSEVRVSSHRPVKEKPARRAGSASPTATHHPHKRHKRPKKAGLVRAGGGPMRGESVDSERGGRDGDRRAAGGGGGAA